MAKKLILVAGGGGFIGGHLVADLLRRGDCCVRSVDVKPMDHWYQQFAEVDNVVADLQELDACMKACDGVSEVYNLAADMGGMGFIENNKALCMLSVLINTHLLKAAVHHGATRFFFASSACVYNAEKQIDFEVTPLKEADAYPAMPEDGYGWEKLFSERMCRHFQEDFGLQARVARFHNVYGPHGTWEGGREKAPAAVSRKVIAALAAGSDSIDIWGDGRQTRSFTYIDDCIHGIHLIMRSDVSEPLNLGSSEMVSINDLVRIVESFFHLNLERKYDLSAPKGVNGRNSDNTLIQSHFGWEPGTRLVDGMRVTCDWIRQEYLKKYGTTDVVSANQELLQRSLLQKAGAVS